jgi:hypothetical protein
MRKFILHYLSGCKLMQTEDPDHCVSLLTQGENLILNSEKSKIHLNNQYQVIVNF